MPGVTVIPPGELAPGGGECYKVFTPYWRRWQPAPRRSLAPAPRRIAIPAAAREGPSAGARRASTAATPSPELPRGGESEGGKRLARWLARGVGALRRACTTSSRPTAPRGSAPTCTSAASPRSSWPSAHAGRAGAEPFVRQLCWRDFYAQLLAARPETSRRRLPAARPSLARRPGRRSRPGRQGRTGFPIIDAGMRQLAREGWMHNRARLLTALLPGQGPLHRLAAWARRTSSTCSSTATWRTTAATGSGSRAPASTPARTACSTRSRRPSASIPMATTCAATCPSSRDIEGAAVHEPWKLARRPEGYPEPILDHGDA